MRNRKSTRRSLIASGLSLAVSCALLLGSTFAWFTDSVVNGNNRIAAGNLDVDLLYKTGETYASVQEDTNLFKENALWEPGYAEAINLKVENLGSLALEYRLSVNIVSETGGVNVNGDPFKFSDYIQFAVIDGEQTYADGAEAVAAAEAANPTSIAALDVDETGVLYPDGEGTSEEYVTLVVYMPETVGNEANYAAGEAQPQINLGVNLTATQTPYETDGFGSDQYDADAAYAVDNGEDLIAALNANKQVVLAGDIDLSDAEGLPVANYSGILDGNGHTLSGLSTNLFTSVTDAAIRDINFAANIDTGDTTHEIAVIAEHAYGDVTLDKVTVSGEVKVYQGSGFIRKVETGHTVITGSENNAAVTSYAQKAAGFICTVGTADVTIRDSVNNGDITAEARRAESSEVYAGGFLAWNSNGVGNVVTLENCVNNGNITGIRTVSGSSTVAAGGISAIAWGISGSFTTNLINVANNGAVVAENADAGHNSHAGGIVGMVNPNAVVNINGAASNGSVTARITNSSNTSGVGNAGGVIGQLNNGRVAMVQISIGDAARIAAQTYAARNNVGALVGNAAGNSSVAYDTETVSYAGSLPYIGNTADTVEVGEVPSNGDELKAALEANADVVLGGDIALSGWSAIGTESEPFTGSLNGNGYTIPAFPGKRPVRLCKRRHR